MAPPYVPGWGHSYRGTERNVGGHLVTDIWRRCPLDNHTWAFVYYCKRQGDRVVVTKHGDGTGDITVTRKGKENMGENQYRASSNNSLYTTGGQPLSLKAPAPERGENMRGGYSAAVSERMEAMVGVDPRTTLDKLREAQENTADLRERLAETMSKLAIYKARYGYPSHWEHERKALLARLANHERERAGSKGEKVTESYLDEYAHSHGEYRSFLAEAGRERERMEQLEAEAAELHSKIETAKGVETYYERHARLNDGLIWHSARELGAT